MLGALKKHSHREQSGFTLIELMIVVAIIGILASVAMGAYQTYTIRAQVSEGILMAANAKVPVVEAYQNNGEAPANRAEAGLIANAASTQGSYVQSLEVNNGRLEVTFGNRANQTIANETLYLTPYETPTGAVVWRCGSEPVPGGGALAPMGASGGGNTASYAPTTIEDRYLPATCRL
jgi:type IV pilus assembly protein PilA